MPSEQIDIVMFGMSCYTEWQAGIANRNFHVLHTLLTDERVRKVVYVEYLPFTWKRALRQWLQNVVGGVGGMVLARGLSHKLTAVRESEIERTGYKLESVQPEAVPYKLFVYTDVGSVWSEARVYQRLRQELKRLDFKNIVLWSYLPTFTGYFGQLGERLSVFEAVDNWLEHSSYASLRDRLKLNYETIRHKADLIFTTSPDLVKFFDRTAGCMFIPNGVSLRHLATAPKVVGRDIANLPRPIIGYGGTLQEDRLDVDLVRYLALANPTKSFVLLGSMWPGIRASLEQKLKPLPNVYFFGRKTYAEAQAYYREFTVAIIPYLQNEFNRHTNPLKLYEYLGVGKPVVATSRLGLEEFGDLIRVGVTPEDFNQQLLKALAETGEAAAAGRKEFVQQHTWDVRVGVMLQQVSGKLPGTIDSVA